MIRREYGSGWFLINQHVHAQLSSAIMSFWGNENFCSMVPAQEVIKAIREHDCGWEKTDLTVSFNPQNGLPRSFMEITTAQQFRIWSDCFQIHAERHPYASALIALHFAKFNERNISKNPNDGYSLLLRRKIREFVLSKLEISSSADNEDLYFNGYLPPDVPINLRFLQVGDMMSLALCHGWKSITIDDVPTNYEESTREITLVSADGINYEVFPSPFSKNSLLFSIVGKELEKRSFSGQKELRDSFLCAPQTTLEFSISSGKKQ